MMIRFVIAVRANRLFGCFVMGLIARLRNRKPCFARPPQPGVHGHTQLSDRLLRCRTERGAGFQVRSIGDPTAVFLGPEYDDGVTVHRSWSSFNPNSLIIS